MFFELKSQCASTRIYRRSLILKVLLIVMVLVDVLSVFFAPVWVFVLFLLVHLCILICWINTKCRLFDILVSELFE